MGKGKFIGTVGAFLLREVGDGVWETMVHRRSDQVTCFRRLLATPGGLVEKQDAVDSRGIMRRSTAFRRALQRQVLKDTDIDIDSIDPNDVFELPTYAHQSDTHQNFGVVLKTSVVYARPQQGDEWEMIQGAVDNIGTPIPGGFHSWMSLSKLLQRSDVMEECRYAVEMCMKILNVEALEPSLPTSSSRSYSVVARVSGIADSTYTRCGVEPDSLSSPHGGEPMSGFEVPPASQVQQQSSCGRLRDRIRYSVGFERQLLYVPEEARPYDVIRKHIGRLSKVSPYEKKGNLQRHDSS